jgi:hypothetical protein
MKSIVTVMAFFFLCIHCFSQQVEARIDTVKSLVIHKYTKGFSRYCEKETYLLSGEDSTFFMGNVEINKNYIKEHPHLTASLGNIHNYTYDYFQDYFDVNFTHNLNFSEYNRHIDGIYVESKSFYEKADDDNLYSVYWFYGSVVFYNGLEPHTTHPGENEFLKNCTCLFISPKVDHFAILKEVIQLEPLTYKQAEEMQFLKSGIRAINVLYCE